MHNSIQDVRDAIAQAESQLEDDIMLRDTIRAIIKSIGVEAVNTDHYYELCERITKAEREIAYGKALVSAAERMGTSAETQQT